MRVKTCLPAKVAALLGWMALVTAGASAAEPAGGGTSDARESWIAEVLVLRPRAEQGDVGSQVQLGDLFHSRQQFAEAVHWYRHAATNREVTAQLALAGYLIAGRGTAENRKEAAYWIRKAADGVEHGSAPAIPNPSAGTAKPMGAPNGRSEKVPGPGLTNVFSSASGPTPKNLFTNSDSRSTPATRVDNVSAIEPRLQEGGFALQPFEIPK